MFIRFILDRCLKNSNLADYICKVTLTQHLNDYVYNRSDLLYIAIVNEF